MMNVQRFCDLSMVKLRDPKDIEEHSGYHYLIRDGAFAHTAFRTEQGLERFLERTGLGKKFVKKLEKLDSYVLEGCYEIISLAGTADDLDEVGRLLGLNETKIVDNGRLTKAFYGRGSIDNSGNKIFHLNPNYPREEYPWRTNEE